MTDTDADIQEQVAEAATLAAALKGTGEAMMEGLMSQQDAMELVMTDLGKREGTVIRKGELGTQGRVTFGRQREGQQGIAIFLPTEPIEEEGADAE